MNNKKRELKIFIFLLISILLINFISADFSQDIGRGFGEVYNIINSIIDNLIKPFVQVVLTNQNERISDDMLFAKLLFLLIIIAVVHLSLKRVDFFDRQNNLLYGIIVGAVSIMATRWLGSEAMINTIILPYSVLGIAISAGLPFIIYFLFIDVGFKGYKYNLIRKVAWVFFIVIFIGLWYTRGPVIAEAGSYARWIYPITLIASICVLLFDGTIQRIWNESRMKQGREFRLNQILIDIDEQIRKAREGMLHGTPRDVAEDIIYKLEEQKKQFIKQFKKSKI